VKGINSGSHPVADFTITLFDLSISYSNKVKSKAISVTGRRGPKDCEKSRLPHFLDNRLTDDGEIVSLTRRPPFTIRKKSDTHFC
jgi:hypothetical protein